MIALQNLFETHLTVTDLDRALAFYRDVVGLQLAYVTSAGRILLDRSCRKRDARTVGFRVGTPENDAAHGVPREPR